jgi:tetratricopeptide (TPR) repeat protein
MKYVAGRTCKGIATMQQTTVEETGRTLAGMVERAHTSRILRALGAPDPSLLTSADLRSLVALNLAAGYHRLAVISDVMRFYRDRTGLELQEYPALALVDEAMASREAMDAAEAAYGLALRIAPALAEVHFGLARLRQLRGETGAALEGMEETLKHAPHPNASPHAHLHANAHWERATLLRAVARNQEALAAYRTALAALPSFGVHHVEAARFFRRMGHIEEGIAHFRRCMTYSHRYFAEFMPPPVMAPVTGSSRVQDVIYETARGELVVFWEGKYVCVATAAAVGAPPGLPLEGLSAAVLAGARSAASIAELEQCEA